MKSLHIVILLLLMACCASAQTVLPNLGVVQLPYQYPHYEIPTNANWAIVDGLFSNGPCGVDGIHALTYSNSGPKRFGCTSALLLLNPAADQTILGSQVLWNQGRTWLGINGNANHTFGLSPDSYLFNIEQDSTNGTTYPNPSVIMGVVGGLTPIADASNLFGNSTVVRDFASAFNVDSLGAIGGSSFWFGTAGKTLAFGYGVIGASYSVGAGDVGENWGVRGLANPGNHPFTFTGTVNHNKGGTFGSGGFSGTINNDYGVFIELPATGATFTNPHEGLHLEDQTVSGALANAYGIRELGNALNDLGGGVTKVGGLLNSALSAILPVCTDGSKNLTSTPCPGVFTNFTTPPGGISIYTLSGLTGSASFQAASSQGSPAAIQLPTSTGTAGQVLSTDGSSPQQTSWVNQPSVQLCGTTTACAKTVQTAPIIVYGTVALVSASPSTATLTALPFTSTSSYVCTGSPVGATAAIAAAGIAFGNASASSTVLTGPNTVTTVINYTCIGN